MGSYGFLENQVVQSCARAPEGLGMSAVGKVRCKRDRMEVYWIISMSRDWGCRRVTSPRSAAVLIRAYVYMQKSLSPLVTLWLSHLGMSTVARVRCTWDGGMIEKSLMESGD